MKTFRFYLFSMIVIFSLALLALSSSNQNFYKLDSEYGKVDFSSIDETQAIILGGTWEQYEGSLYEDLLKKPNLDKEYVIIPHEWEPNPEYDDNPYGYSTYVTEISGLDPDKYYGVFIIDESTSYRLFVNDKFIISNGKVGRTIDEYYPELKGELGAFAPDEFGKARIVIEIANFVYSRGGFWTEPIIGEFNLLNKINSTHVSLDVVLFTSILLPGLFLLALYSKMKSEKTTLLMGIFSLIIAFRALFSSYRIITSIIPALPFTIIDRFQYLFGFLLLPLAGYITSSLGYIKQSKIIKYIYHLLLFIGIVLSLFASNYIYTTYLEIYKYLIIVFGIYYFYYFFMGIRFKKPGAIPITIGYLAVITGTIVELFILNIPFLLAFASFIMVGIFTASQIVTFSSLKTQKETLESEIIIDKLTSLYNRLYLEKLITESSLEKNNNHSWYVLFIDVNRFKQINDTYGHHIGDLVLIKVAQILKQSIRDTDKPFRFGGDEFVLLVSLEKTIDPKVIVERINSKLKDPLEIEGHLIDVSLSIGVTEYLMDDENLYKAILRSDEQMYNIKHSLV